jgi:threonine/homoserine/homoserine lactone efflux protein
MGPGPDLLLFFGIVLGVIALPGMDMAYVASSSATDGITGGIAAVCGIVVAGVAFTLAAAAGVDVLAALPYAYNVLLVAGGGYMAWVGINILRASDGPTSQASLPPQPRMTIFRRAMVTCLLNPKAYAFTLAVFPAFFLNSGYSIPVQAMRLGLVIAITQATVYGTVAAITASARKQFRLAGIVHVWLPRVVGVLMLAGSGYVLFSAWQCQANATPVSPASDGAPMKQSTPDSSHDFDFLIGRWTLHNQKMDHPLTHSTKWESFDADLDVRELPGRMGNYDRLRAEKWRPGYVGLTVRIFNPATGRWNIYSADNHGNGFDQATGALAPPVQGRFTGNHADFDGPDVLDGKPIVVRYRWTRVDDTHFLWEQLFSPDGGATWESNWKTQATKETPAKD